MQRGSAFLALIIIPLLLTTGGWTLMFREQFSILQSPVPIGIPAAPGYAPR